MVFKTIWFSINGNEMMKEDMKMIIGLLKPYSTELNLYNNGSKISYLKIETDTKTWSNNNLQRQLSSWVFYHPINKLYQKPKNISEHDLIDRF